jgi:hypothetical protein
MSAAVVVESFLGQKSLRRRTADNCLLCSLLSLSLSLSLRHELEVKFIERAREAAAADGLDR